MQEEHERVMAHYAAMARQRETSERSNGPGPESGPPRISELGR